LANAPIDRKALRREYKETVRPAGVFAVRNIVDDILFVGASSDLPSMFNRQRFQLDMNAHPDKRLQTDWKRLGPDAFSFEVLDRLEAPEDPQADLRRDLATLRDMWLTKLAAEGQALYSMPERHA
jgi:hypothetical protein